MAREDGMGFGDNFPKYTRPSGTSYISHDKATGHWEDWGRLDVGMRNNLLISLIKRKIPKIYTDHCLIIHSYSTEVHAVQPMQGTIL